MDGAWPGSLGGLRAFSLDPANPNILWPAEPLFRSGAS
jgi:hypothetical protein